MIRTGGGAAKVFRVGSAVSAIVVCGIAHASESIRPSTLNSMKLGAPYADAFQRYVRQQAAETKVPNRLEHPTVFFVKDSVGYAVRSREMKIIGSDMSGEYGVEYYESRGNSFNVIFSLQASETTAEDDVFGKEFRLLEVLFRGFLLQRGFKPALKPDDLPKDFRLSRKDEGRSFLDVQKGKQKMRYAVGMDLDPDDHPEVTACMKSGKLEIWSSYRFDAETILIVAVPYFRFGSEGDGWCRTTERLLRIKRSASGVTVTMDGKRLRPM